jgi:hypothetical protein
LQAHPDATSFIDGAYQDVLGRTVDPAGLSAAEQLLQQPQGQAVLANVLLTSTERERQVVDGNYQTLLGRSADAAGEQAWLQALQSDNVSADLLAELFLASQEYFARSGGS